MRRVFATQDTDLIHSMLSQARFGTLALSGADKTNPDQAVLPYAVPVNFVYHNEAVYFHSSPKGKKMRLIAANPKVSFNVVSEESIIPSYFSSTENLACPATSFFKSVTIDGTASIITARADIAEIFTAMMQALQPEGNYQPFSEKVYDDEFKALVLVKITTESLSAKFKFGQQLSEERFQMIIEHLKTRGHAQDLQTIAAMEQHRTKP